MYLCFRWRFVSALIPFLISQSKLSSICCCNGNRYTGVEEQGSPFLFHLRVLLVFGLLAPGLGSAAPAAELSLNSDGVVIDHGGEKLILPLPRLVSATGDGVKGIAYRLPIPFKHGRSIACVVELSTTRLVVPATSIVPLTPSPVADTKRGSGKINFSPP